MAERDIVAIAGSAGAVSELTKLLHHLPKTFTGTVFIVVHTSPEGPGLLPGILARAAQLPVHNPQPGERIKRGHIYVAKPNHHLLVLPGHVELSRGPRENGFRPAADPLFRTAAQSYGNRVVGILLTGGMDDGTLGLQAIKQHGGIAIVQDPKEAFDPSMPESAIRNVDVDHVLPVKDMPGVLLRLLKSRVKEGNEMKRRQKKQTDPALAADLSPTLDGPPPPSYALNVEEDYGNCKTDVSFTIAVMSAMPTRRKPYWQVRMVPSKKHCGSPCVL